MLRKGVASNFLTELPIGGKFLSCHQFNDHFTMPEDLSLPLIMICAGSGIAPFRHSIYSRTVSSYAQNFYFLKFRLNLFEISNTIFKI